MERHYLKLSNQNIFTPKYVRGYSSGGIRSRKILTNFPKTTKFSSSEINDFYSSIKYNQDKSNLLISSNNFLYSPKRNILKKNYRNIRSSKQKPKSSSFQKLLPSVNRNMTQNKFCLETEKLYHETYQIKKVIQQLEQELFYLSQENLIKDEQLNEKEQEINNIINNNYKTFDDDDGYNDNYNINISDINSSMGVLILKIKKEIRNTNNEIKNENFKLKYLKRSLYLTKIKELNVESKLLQQQSNKINRLIDNALEIKNENDKTMEEYEHLKENINRQEIILSNLNDECISLEQEEYFLNNQLQNLKNELKTKIEKAKKNNNELNALSLKNKNLNNDKIIKSQTYTTKINGMPITIKSLYTNKLSDLKKNINFYKRQCKYTDDMINKLQDQRKKLVDANKSFEQKLKISQNLLQHSTNIKKLNRPQSSLGTHKTVLKDEDIINNLKEKYKLVRENEVVLEQKATTYFEKLVEIDKENEEKERKEKEKEEENQIEFGIDENNPYYTDNEENVPESHIKFTSSQFNQFTYILFKNFEAKFIVAEEANSKIINPFYEFIKKENITTVKYPSKEFDNIIEEFTKIIMKELKSDNEYNHTLTRMFIGALLYNSECDANKLVEYFSILFSYTRNYILEEKKFIEKLKTKYKNQTKKLVECITSYILNDLSSSPYFSLFKMKDLLDKNEINLKDKYIEFLFYYMKKFSDPDAKLEDLKFSLLNDIVPIGDTTVHSKAFINDLDKDIDLENNLEENLEENANQKENKETEIENIIENEEKNKKENEKEEEYKKEIEKEDDNNKEIEKEEKSYKEIEKEINNNENIDREEKKEISGGESVENEEKKEISNNEEENKKIDIKNENKENILNKNNSNKNSENSKKEPNISNNDDNNFDIEQCEIKPIEDDKENKDNKITEKSNKSKNNDNNNIINNANKETKKSDENEPEINQENSKKTDKNLENNIALDDKNEKQQNDSLNKDNKKNISTDKFIDNEINKIDNDKVNKLNESKEKNSIDKFMDKSQKKEDENNSENNQNNEPVLNNETEKEEIVETGNYENKEKKDINTSKDKEDIKEEIKKSKIEKYKEDEYIVNTNNNEENKEKEDEEEKKPNDSNHVKKDEDNLNGDDESVTEITNEEYKKQIIESINLIQNGLSQNSTDFNDLINTVTGRLMIEGELMEYINIEDFNEKIISLGVKLTDLQLSCLCSRYSLPNELRLIDKNKFEGDLKDYQDGFLKI